MTKHVPPPCYNIPMRPSLRYEILSVISQSPRLFFPYYRLRERYRGLLVTRDSELVIEGFPRSANTFSVLAFEAAQDRPVRLAHHLHSQAQIQKAVEWNIPTLVLIREPASAVTSLITRHPEIRIDQAFRQYGRFYRYIESCRDSVVIADFKEVTRSFDKVIGRLNRRFGTAFKPYRNSDEQDAQILSRIYRLPYDGGQISGQRVARRSKERNEGNQSLYRHVTAHSLASPMHALYLHLAPDAD